MSSKTTILAVVLFVLVIAGMFGYAYLKKQELNTPTTPMPQEEIPQDQVRINGVHFFKDGTHTIVGEMSLPTPCHLLTTSSRVQESMPETAVIDFEVLDNGEEMCAQVITPQRYKVVFSASEQAKVTATYNGKPAILNLVPGDPNQNPDDLDEFYFKG